MKHTGYKEMVRAMQNDDARYDGVFYVAVRTTGIYCLPSCKARLPHLKNVLFFTTREEAVRAGFRGCKRCRAESFPDVSPPWLSTAFSFMKNTVDRKLRQDDLSAAVGVDISTIRRHFRVSLKTTPMAYHRKLRLEHAKSLLESGADYLTAAYASGFESSSGFRDAFLKYYGIPPGRAHAV